MLSFECRHDNKIILVLFYGQEESTTLTAKTEVRDSYRGKLKPDGVIFLYPEYLSKNVKSLFNDDRFKIDIGRYGEKVFVQSISFNVQGVLKADSPLMGELVEFQLEQLQVDLIKYGIAKMVEERKDQILAKSPPGTVFSKPSGKVLEEFIYASHVTRDYAENQFLAFCLLSRAPEISSIDWIYIDTSGISTVAEAIIYYVHCFEDTACKRLKYKSYSSYSGLKKVKPDLTSNIWVIISASASTSMGKRMRDEWTMKPEQIITLLSYEEPLSKGDKNEGNSVLFCVKDYSTSRSNVTSPIKVEIKGENFTAEVDVSRSVVVRKKHKPAHIESAVAAFRDQGIFSCNRTGINIKKKPLFIDFDKILEVNPKVVSDWLDKVVTWHVPKSLEMIVVDNKYSGLLKQLLNALDRNGFDRDKIEICDKKDFITHPDLGKGSIIVLSPVVTSGRFFMDVNRELRLHKHDGMRLFIAGYTLSNSKHDFEEFKKSLTFGTGGFFYQYFDCFRVFVGSKHPSSWDDELKYLDDLEAKSGLNEFWRARKSILEKHGDGLTGLIGVRYGGVDQKLLFTKDFAFWNKNQEIKNVNPEAVYFTVASVLQGLRDSKGEDTLKSSVYQHYVLDPENFVRFNDPLLQSCLWRAALPTEMDYRMSDKLSADMKNIIITLINSHHSGRGEAALDLFLGLCLGRIKLTSNDDKEVKAVAKEKMHGNCIEQLLTIDDK